jgi:hypothetical protein
MRIALVLALLALPAPALAQFYAHPLFVEAARDPGRAEQATSPMALATGGQLGAGSPEAAMFAPSTLMTARDTGVAFWGGSSRYRRTEFTLTPGLLSSGTDVREPAETGARAFGAVAADRGSDWALALFIDSSALAHRFGTETNRLTQMFAHGSASWVDGTGAVDVSSRVTRFGGSLAFQPARYVAIGASLYAVRLRHAITADIETSVCGFLAGEPTRCSPGSDTAASEIADTRTGMAFSATIGNDRLSVTGRWRREPRFEGERAGQAIVLDLPDVRAVGMRATSRLTSISAEVSQERRSGTFASNPDAPEYCGAARIPDCPGWGFGEFELEDALAVRAGIEQRIPNTRLTLLLGAATEPSGIARIIVPGERAIDDSGRVYRVTGGAAWRRGGGSVLEAGASLDRYGLVMTAGYRIRLR